MRLKLHTPVLAGVLLILIVISGCTVRQDAVIRTDGSGTLRFDITLMPFFVQTIEDAADAFGAEEMIKKGRVFNLDEIQKDFAKKQSVTLHGITSPSAEKLTGELSFTNIEKVFLDEKELAQTGVVRFSSQGAKKTLSVHLDKNNIKQLTALFPILQNPFFEMFMPQKNEKISESEYLEMLDFVFGDQGTPGVKKSAIELTVSVKGTILSQTGGVQQGNTVTFSIPLLRVLMLDKPLDYSIVFTG